MEWKRAKDILIILFLMIDIFLLGLNVYKNNGTDTDFSKISTVLSKNNIQVSQNVIPKSKKSGFVYEFYSVSLGEDIKKDLLGEYEKKGKNDFSSKDKNATLSISSNKISYNNKEPNFKNFSDVNEKNVNKKLKTYIKMLGIKKYVKLESVLANDGEYTVNYSFYIDGNSLFSSKLEFVVSKKGIHTINAILNIPDNSKGYKFELSGIETILLNFGQNSDFKKTTEIKNITYGYYISEYENAVAYQALPVYNIETKDNFYIYDARDGVDGSQRCLSVLKK